MKKTLFLGILMAACQEPDPVPLLKVWSTPQLPQIEERSSFIKEGVWCGSLFADDELTQKIENRALYIDVNDKNEWLVWYMEVEEPGWPEAKPSLWVFCNNNGVDGWFCEITGRDRRWLSGSFRLEEGPDNSLTYFFMKEPGKKEKLLGGMVSECPDNFPYISFDDRVRDLKKIREWLY